MPLLLQQQQRQPCPGHTWQPIPVAVAVGAFADAALATAAAAQMYSSSAHSASPAVAVVAAAVVVAAALVSSAFPLPVAAASSYAEGRSFSVGRRESASYPAVESPLARYARARWGLAAAAATHRGPCTYKEREERGVGIDMRGTIRFERPYLSSKLWQVDSKRLTYSQQNAQIR